MSDDCTALFYSPQGLAASLKQEETERRGTLEVVPRASKSAGAWAATEGRLIAGDGTTRFLGEELAYWCPSRVPNVS